MTPRPADVHPQYEAHLNGVPFGPDAAELPPAVPCSRCGAPVYLGTITCLVPGHPDEGKPWAGVWEVRNPSVAPALGLHRCPSRPGGGLGPHARGWDQ